MKFTSVKAMVAKVMTVGLLAGAVVMAAPAKAQAQGFAVQVGFRHYDYSRRDRFEFERRQEFIRQQEWARAHRFHDGYYR